MIFMDKDLVIISLNSKKSVDVNTELFIKDVGTVYCKNSKIQNSIENLKVFKGIKEEDWASITATDIASKVINMNNKIDLTMIGSTEVLIEIKSQETVNKFIEFLKVVMVCIILFFGAGIAIINFHKDVNMIETMEKIYFSFTGIENEKPLIMVIPYSFGLGLGMIVFFNRVFSFSKRRKKEPGPMEIELYLYDLDMEEYILNEIKKGNQSGK